MIIELVKDGGDAAALMWIWPLDHDIPSDQNISRLYPELVFNNLDP